MTTTSTARLLDRPDGRRIAVHDLTQPPRWRSSAAFGPAVSDGELASSLTSEAPADAPVVLMIHPAPGSGRFDPDPTATARNGVRLISVDRAGYGGSDPVGAGAFATVATAADDVVAVLEDVLPAGATAGLAGWSAGGRVALAVAARRPDLVRRVAVIGTPAPDEEVPWIPEEQRAGIDALRGLPAADAHAALAGAFAPMLAALTGDARFGLVGIDEADAGVLADPGVVDRLRAMLDEALAQGGAGMIADIAGYTLQPWGFEPADVAAEVLLGYGAADFVGPDHGAWWEKTLPHARLEVVPEVGHLVVVPLWEQVLGHLTRQG
ncbi:alpha/beta fold hydrolase [Pseudonocardia nigra]|uniref:alpha/beta fold hydrolase n=1 Tax=Pseudonocardia nigra TaxID=1921578 RepID=UPI001C5F3894|nr:alpha/beta hydrolase [Pseudonocardia nigra]